MNRTRKLVILLCLVALGLSRFVYTNVFYQFTSSSETGIIQPDIVLEHGTSGTSFIYSNGTSASVTVDSYSTTFYPNNYNLTTGQYVSGSTSSSVNQVDADYFTVTSTGTNTTNLNYFPLSYNLIGNTTLNGGSISNLTANDEQYINFGSTLSGTIPTTEIDPVDNDTSDADSSTDKGFYKNFILQQMGPDNQYDTLREQYFGNLTLNYVDNNSSDVDSSAGIGTHSNFSSQQSGSDSVYDLLTETNNLGFFDLDLEIQWIDIHDIYQGSELAIKTGSYNGSEQLRIDFFNSTDEWQTLGYLESDSWNNFTIRTYLFSSNFTVRFKGTNETDDLTRDAWQIDTSLIRLLGKADGEIPVESNTSDIDLSPNAGINSNFTSQQIGPDTIYDILSEEYTFTGNYDEYIWISGNDDQVRKFNKSDIGSEILSWDTGTSYPFGLDFRIEDETEYIYVVDSGTGPTGDKLVKFHANNGSEVTRWDISSYSGNGEGLVWNGSRWFIADRGDQLIYQVDPADPTVAERSFSFSGIASSSGLAWDGSYLWVTDYGTDKVYQIDLNGNIQTSWDFTPMNPRGIAYDSTSGHLWIVSDVYPGNLYEYDINGTEIGYLDPSGSMPMGVSYARFEKYSYDLDLESQWTNLAYDLPYEELCVYTGSLGDEDIIVEIWNTTSLDWDIVFSDLNASSWNNASITNWLTSDTLTIRYRGENEIGDSFQDQWEIDVALVHVWDDGIAEYRFDMEYQWTDVNLTHPGKELCIKGGSMGAENILVDVWYNDTWNNVFADLSPDWNNVSVTQYFYSSNFTIRVRDGTTSSDAFFDTWDIDVSLIRFWDNVYTAEIEFMGSSNLYEWTQIEWIIDSSSTNSSTNLEIQLYNFSSSSYPDTGNGYLYYTSGAADTDETKKQDITNDPIDFRNATSGWIIKIKAEDTSQFDLKLDYITLNTTYYDEYSVQTEFIFTDITDSQSPNLNFTTITHNSVDGATITLEIWNYTTSSYSSSGQGYASFVSTGSNNTQWLNISTNPSSCINNTDAKIRVTTVYSTTQDYQNFVNFISLLQDPIQKTHNYALRVKNLGVDTYNLRLVSLSETGLSRLINCTILLNSTTQIQVIDGTITLDTGTWANILGSGNQDIIIMASSINQDIPSTFELELEARKDTTTVVTYYPIMTTVR